MSKTAPRIADRNAPDRSWLDQIPTDDADAALQFCRALVRQIDSSAAPTIDRDYENFLKSQLDTSTPLVIGVILTQVWPSAADFAGRRLTWRAVMDRPLAS